MSAFAILLGDGGSFARPAAARPVPGRRVARVPPEEIEALRERERGRRDLPACFIER